LFSFPSFEGVDDCCPKLDFGFPFPCNPWNELLKLKGLPLNENKNSNQCGTHSERVERKGKREELTLCSVVVLIELVFWYRVKPSCLLENGTRIDWFEVNAITRRITFGWEFRVRWGVRSGRREEGKWCGKKWEIVE